MKDGDNKLIWGLLLVFVGVVIGLNSVFGFHINIFFSGWWTLILIIPSLINIIKKDAGFPSYFIFGIGIVFLLKSNKVLESVSLYELVAAILFFSVGFAIISSKKDKKNRKISRTKRSKHSEKAMKETLTAGNSQKEQMDEIRQERVFEPHRYKIETISGILSSNQRQYIKEPFAGCTVNSILGNVQIDIRNAMIAKDMYIDVTGVLGGIDLYIPSNVIIVNQCTTVLGEVESKIKEPSDMTKEIHTLYIRGTCILSGIEIR